MVIILKVYKADNFEPDNPLKFSFTDIWGFCSNFAECESFLEWNYPYILVLCYINLDDSIDSGNFFVRSSLIRKDSITQMHCLAVYVKKDFFLHGSYL